MSFLRVVLGPLAVVSALVWFMLVLARNQERRVVVPLVMSLIGFVARSYFAFAPGAVSSRRTQSSQKDLESYV